jgi:hypothetical protein
MQAKVVFFDEVLGEFGWSRDLLRTRMDSARRTKAGMPEPRKAANHVFWEREELPQLLEVLRGLPARK